MKNQDLKEEIRKIAPGLDGFQETNPYQVPAGYFSNLPETIGKRLHEEAIAENRAATFFKPARIAWIASIMVIVIATTVVMLNNSSIDKNYPLSEEQWIDEYFAWFSDTDTYNYYYLLLSFNMQESEPDDIESMNDGLIIDFFLDAELYYLDDDFAEDI